MNGSSPQRKHDIEHALRNEEQREVGLEDVCPGRNRGYKLTEMQS